MKHCVMQDSACRSVKEKVNWNSAVIREENVLLKIWNVTYCETIQINNCPRKFHE